MNPTKSRYTKTSAQVLIVAGVALYVVVSIWLGFFDTAQEKISDRFFTFTKPPQNIIVIAIDDQSIEEIGAWPWPRVVFAELVSNLDQAEAIGIDVHFSENSHLGNADDMSLGRALQNSEVPIILPIQLREDGVLWIAPLPLFGQHAQQGFINIFPDSDGVLRRAVKNIGEYVSFPNKLAGQNDMPESFRIFFYGPEKTFITIPAIDVLQGEIPKNFFKDSLILIGATAPSLHDFVNTPFGRIPGIEAHATQIANINEGIFIRPISIWFNTFLIIVLSFAGLFLVSRISRFLYLIL